MFGNMNKKSLSMSVPSFTQRNHQGDDRDQTGLTIEIPRMGPKINLG